MVRLSYGHSIMSMWLTELLISFYVHFTALSYVFYALQIIHEKLVERSN